MTSAEYCTNPIIDMFAILLRKVHHVASHKLRATELAACRAPLHQHDLTDIFAQKNNKTVGETIAHKRYAHLAPTVLSLYPSSLIQPLGSFLFQQKQAQNPFYKRFLNPYGDQSFCTFSIFDPVAIRQYGLYCYAINDDIQYIGRCHDSFGKRVNQGYGRIHPKNCYLDGQATNCHLNALIAQVYTQIQFFIALLTDRGTINHLERQLIQTLQPAWNIALKPRSAHQDTSE